MSSGKELIVNTLNIAEYENNLYPVNKSYSDKRLEYYRIQAEIVKADYFYCFNNLTDDQLIPFIYIYDQRDIQIDKKINLVNINKQLWTLGEIALAIILCDDEIKIIDTRKPIKSESEYAELDGLSQTIRQIDSSLKQRIFDGRILEESPADYVSLSPYQKLLSHIDKKILMNSNIKCRRDLLKRLLVKFILIKYLEEQRDSVFTADFFRQFTTSVEPQSLFTKSECSFCNVLRNGNIIGLLDALNNKFNGGIFKLSGIEEQELQNVDFVPIANALDGSFELDGQMSIWKYYDFNLLPIEFISRLYESFVVAAEEGKQKSTGAFYTPPHLARLIVDELLPFDRTVDFNDFKILDPSCGSGVFLVLAYKRLITLWMLENNKKTIEGEDDINTIKAILSKCIYGVDINEDSLSITATSLQIELSSHINPKEIWERLTFDNLEEQGNLVCCGFFKWYKTASASFDIIVGNPPFKIANKEQQRNISKGLDNDLSIETFIDYKRKTQNFPENNPALIFLHRSLDRLLKPDIGLLFMIMPATAILYNTKSFEYKKTLASHWNLEKIYDFTPLRGHLWGKTHVATVAIKLTNKLFEKKPVIEHIVIRNTSANERGAIRFQVDKYDKYYVPIEFVFSKKSIWKVNLLGGGRLQQIIEKYKRYPIIANYFEDNKITANIGYTRDKDVINDPEEREKGRVINLNGTETLVSDAFIRNELDLNSIEKITIDDWVRIPSAGFNPPNVLIRLNINAGLPIVYNTRWLAIPNGVLMIKAADSKKMKSFIAVFKENRDFYSFFIEATSPKVFVQQGGGYSINRQEILNLPVDIREGSIIPFVFDNQMETDIITDTRIIINSINKSSCALYDAIDNVILADFCTVLCETLNLTYGLNKYSFKPVRSIISNDYVWVTLEHTDSAKTLFTNIDTISENVFRDILYDDLTKNALTINRIIISYQEKNRISLIKPNKLKYWMRTIAYRDAENIRGDMYNNGY